MSNDKQKDTEYILFTNVFSTRVKLYNKKAALKKEIEEKIKEQNILKTILHQKEKDLEKNNKLLNKDFTFTLSKGTETYFEILEISNIKNETDKKQKFIYKAKRLYLSYKENDNSKISYFCDFINGNYSILADDGTEWKGVDVWKNFTEMFKNGIEFKTIEHFFGMTYKPVQSRIEKINEGNL